MSIVSGDRKVSSTGGLPCLILPKKWRVINDIEIGDTIFVVGHRVLFVFPPDYEEDLEDLKMEVTSLMDFMIYASTDKNKKVQKAEKVDD